MNTALRCEVQVRIAMPYRHFALFAPPCTMRISAIRTISHFSHHDRGEPQSRGTDCQKGPSVTPNNRFGNQPNG
jgi:hypothetical protein